MYNWFVVGDWLGSVSIGNARLLALLLVIGLHAASAWVRSQQCSGSVVSELGVWFSRSWLSRGRPVDPLSVVTADGRPRHPPPSRDVIYLLPMGADNTPYCIHLWSLDRLDKRRREGMLKNQYLLLPFAKCGSICLRFWVHSEHDDRTHVTCSRTYVTTHKCVGCVSCIQRRVQAACETVHGVFCFPTTVGGDFSTSLVSSLV